MKFNFYDSSKKLYVLGESHIENDTDLQISLLDYIISNTDIDVFIFEVSDEIGKIFNDYILHNFRKPDIDIICSLMDKRVAKKTLAILDYLKAYNLKASNKIQVAGIDMFRFYKLNRQTTALGLIFPELKTVNLPCVHEYIVEQNVKDLKKMNKVSLLWKIC